MALTQCAPSAYAASARRSTTATAALRTSAHWLVARGVHGVGGVGHLAVQFADKMGFRVVATVRGAAREDLAHRLGATEYIDSTAVDDVGQALQALGAATVIFDTVSRGNLQSALVSGGCGRKAG